MLSSKNWIECSVLRISPQLLPHTITCLNTVRFSENYILKVIRKLDPSKAHCHDKISICMLKLSDKTSCKPLFVIFISCIETRVFALHWKKPMMCSSLRKQVSNLWKITDKFINLYNEAYPYLIDNLIPSHQSGFNFFINSFSTNVSLM